MSAISMGLNNPAPAPPDIRISLIVTGITNGIAHPGDLLGARLSNGARIETYSWGSTLGSPDYGSQPTLTVPAGAAGRALHVTVNTRKHQFTAVVNVGGAMVPENDILPGPEVIRVESLAPRLETALRPSAGTDTIIVEID